MSFACVRNLGCECTGCMMCQERTAPEMKALASATEALDAGGRKLRTIRELAEKLSNELESLREFYQKAVDRIPEGSEYSSEYDSLEHNLDGTDAAIDYLLDVKQSLDDMVS